MAYWCDDRSLLIEQQRLDAEQADALRRIEARRDVEVASPVEAAPAQQVPAVDVLHGEIMLESLSAETIYAMLLAQGS